MSGGTVIRPLFFEFPYDEYARNVSNQFMWGSAILVMPYVMEVNMLNICSPHFIYYRHQHATYIEDRRERNKGNGLEKDGEERREGCGRKMN